MNRTASPRPLSLLAALVMTLAAPLAWAQEPSAPPPPPLTEAPDAPAPAAKRSSTLKLTDGTELKGRIVQRSPQMTTVELEDGSLTSLSSDRIVSVSGDQGPGARAAAASDAAIDEKDITTLTLSDGQVIRGHVISRDEQNTTVKLTSGGTMTLSSNSIRDLKVEKGARVERGQVWLPDANRTRYLYAPSGMMLKQGEGYFSQKELFFSSVALGVTDNISVLAGSVLPLWAVGGGNGANFIFALKGGFSPSENVHLAGGAETLILPGLSGGWALNGVGFVFGAATFGTPMLHGTVAVGRPFFFSTATTSSPPLGELIFTLNGSARIHQNFSLVTENWVLPGFANISNPFDAMLNALALRIMLDRWTVDVGAVRVGTFPVPWLDISYHWG